jgi:hypothetical protein
MEVETLGERIAKLENAIRANEVKLDKAMDAGDDVREERYSGLIKEQYGTLKLLIQERLGNFIRLYIFATMKIKMSSSNATL